MFTFNFGKHKGKTTTEVMETDSAYLLWVYSTFKSINPKLKEFIENNKKTIEENAKQEEADFLYDYCDGEVSIEY